MEDTPQSKFRGWLIPLLVPLVPVAIGMYVSLQVLMVKLDSQQVKAAERYRILTGIQTNVQSNAVILNRLSENYQSLSARLNRVEVYIPSSLQALEKAQITLKAKYDLLEFKYRGLTSKR